MRNLSTNIKKTLLQKYAQVAQALSVSLRLILLAQGERSAGEPARKTGGTRANCFRHLQQQRSAGLVASRPNGKRVTATMARTGTAGTNGGAAFRLTY